MSVSPFSRWKLPPGLDLANFSPATFVSIHLDLYPSQRSAPLAFLAKTLGDGKTLGKLRCVVFPLLLPQGQGSASAIGLKGTEASYCREIDEDGGAMAGRYNCGIRSISGQSEAQRRFLRPKLPLTS